MAITRYTYRSPWRDLDQLTNRLSRAMWRDTDEFPTPSGSGNWLLSVSVEEAESELIMTAELPGMQPGDVDRGAESSAPQHTALEAGSAPNRPGLRGFRASHQERLNAIGQLS